MLESRSLSEISEVDTIRVSIDIVSAARRNLGFLRSVCEARWLHQRPTIVEAIRRYEEVWMPLMADLSVGSKPPMILPPIDIEWVWFCHTLNPVSYRNYCESKFSKLIGKPAIFDEENEDYALMRCREFWTTLCPSEPFENYLDSDIQEQVVTSEELVKEVVKQRYLYSKFSEPYMTEIVYLIAAKQRYKGFLYMLQRFENESSSRLVLAKDILLICLIHQSYPTVYAEDLKEIEGDMCRVVGAWETATRKEIEETRKLWDRTFGEPYEKAGGGLALEVDGFVSVKPPVQWEVSDTDANTKYKSMLPRFLLEVCVFVRLDSKMKAMEHDMIRNFIRLRMAKGHRELKLDKPYSKFPYETWKKAWHVYCEFGTQGILLELRRHGGFCFKESSLIDNATFYWNDLLRAHSLTLQREVQEHLKVVTSMTPPVQAPYLLKCVPDRVTDDSGAMISDVILRMNQYRPQEGRWLSRTVLDHLGRECFIVRIRIGGGIWRRGAETPAAVRREDRVIEIREGSWSYVAGSIGRAPEKVVGTATPKDPPDEWHAAWHLPTGHELLIQWESTATLSGLKLCLTSQTSPDFPISLLKGRKMQYQIKKINSDYKEKELHTELKYEEEEKETGEDEEENEYVTLIRFTEENPTGKATALINWKLLVVEFVPEEDAVLVLLLCISILKSVTELQKEDVGKLLLRRRIKEAKRGARDWGSVILHPSSYPPSISSPYIQPWYWNAKAVMAKDGADQINRQPALSYLLAEGSDRLYKSGVIS